MDTYFMWYHQHHNNTKDKQYIFHSFARTNIYHYLLSDGQYDYDEDTTRHGWEGRVKVWGVGCEGVKVWGVGE